jgi:uncharacterized protein (TIGR02271 family)
MTNTRSTPFDTSEVTRWRGRTMITRDGDKIGKIDEIYLDEETGRPEWALVNTGLLGMKSNFVPLTGAESVNDEVLVEYSKDQVKEAPGMDPEGQLSQQEEAELYSHYGLDYSKRRSGSGLPEGSEAQAGTSAEGTAEGTAAGAGGGTGAGGGRFSREEGDAMTRSEEGDDAMTRSEEELRVGTAERETGRARLRKFVETEQVDETVPVRRETARVEREPITDDNVDEAMSGPEISETEHEVTLHEEEPVVEKRAVPKERVRLEKDTETDQEEISETVRKERVEPEGDAR